MDGFPSPSSSRLASALREGRFAVTCDLHPPRGSDLEPFDSEAALLLDWTDALFVTEAPGARPRMSSLAACIHLRHALGVEPVLQVVCIRSNRLALQGELLGAAALGIVNLLILGGDPAALGSCPQAEDVRCLDSIACIAMARDMRDEGRLVDGSPLRGNAPFLIGAAVDPQAGPDEMERLRKKLEAGADFLVTQPVCDVAAFASWWEEARHLLGGRPLLAGVLVLGNPRTARKLADSLPGVRIPESVLERLASSARPAAEGASMAADAARALRELPGLGGVHFMNACGAENVVAAIRKSGLRKA
ncbi:MAG: methylenetetrahydrofolate reductase [Actinobacteria bacterium]|nr:methylenetetrahydrofolate reductase [Actinomycetota bacterium]